MALPQQINNDEEYMHILDRIVKGARAIEDPLTTEEERQRYMRAYDHLCKIALEYRLGRGWHEKMADQNQRQVS